VPNADVYLVRLPEGVDFLTAAALGCRYMTAYHAVADRAQVRPGEWVAIFGVGGVGLSAVQIASALGARVIAVDISEDKLERARQEGALITVNARAENPVGKVRAVTDGGADVGIDALGSAQTALNSVFSLRRGGRHIQVGLTSQQEQGMISLPIDIMVVQEINLVTSLGCPVTSYPGLLSLVASSRLDPRRLVGQTIPVEGVNDVLNAMTEFGTVGFHIINRW